MLELELKKFSEIVERGGIKIPKNFKVFIKRGSKNLIRCQKKLKGGKQCLLPAIEGSVFCKGHSKKNLERQIVNLELAKKGIYIDDCALRNEINEVLNSDEQDYLSIKKDVARSEAVLNMLLKTKIVDYKIGDHVLIGRMNKVIKTESDLEMAMEYQKSSFLKSIQYVIMNNSKIKRDFWDIKLGNYQSVSKELFMFAMNSIMAVIREEVTDIDMLKRITDKIENIGIEIKLKGYK